MWRCRAATLPYTVLCEAVKPYMSKETRKYRSKFCSCTFEVMACVKQEVGLFSDGDARTPSTPQLYVRSLHSLWYMDMQRPKKNFAVTCVSVLFSRYTCTQSSIQVFVSIIITHLLCEQPTVLPFARGHRSYRSSAHPCWQRRSVLYAAGGVGTHPTCPSRYPFPPPTTCCIRQYTVKADATGSWIRPYGSVQ